jgi:hypothetical protein
MNCTDTRYFCKCKLSRFLWDDKSKFFFDPSSVLVETFTFSAKEEFGNSGLISISGAPANSVLLCEDIDNVIEITVLNHKLFESPMVMTIVQDENSDRVLKIKYMRLREAYQNRGIEARMLLTCVKACQKFGFKEIRTKCTFEEDSKLGAAAVRLDWVTAVNLGFDACLPEDYFKSLPNCLSHAHTIKQLLWTSGGMEHWRKNPVSLSLFFDLHSESESMINLSNHIANQKIVIYQ